MQSITAPTLSRLSAGDPAEDHAETGQILQGDEVLVAEDLAFVGPP
jgi:hypothetical protein